MFGSEIDAISREEVIENMASLFLHGLLKDPDSEGGTANEKMSQFTVARASSP